MEILFYQVIGIMMAFSVVDPSPWHQVGYCSFVLLVIAALGRVMSR